MWYLFEALEARGGRFQGSRRPRGRWGLELGKQLAGLGKCWRGDGDCRVSGGWDQSRLEAG